MKFVSKTTNLCIILRPGMSAQPLTGTPAVPTIYVRFNDGLARVEDPKLIEMMLLHPGYEKDYFPIDETQLDPFRKTRQSSEPDHIITEMKYGHPEKRVETHNNPTQVPPQIMKLIEEQALAIGQQIGKEIAEKALPGMVETKLREIVRAHEAEKKALNESIEVQTNDETGYSEVTTLEPVKRPGRPKKVI